MYVSFCFQMMMMMTMKRDVLNRKRKKLLNCWSGSIFYTFLYIFGEEYKYIIGWKRKKIVSYLVTYLLEGKGKIFTQDSRQVGLEREKW